MSAIDALGSRGLVLWRSLGEDAGSARGELALEACRAADRSARLDAWIVEADSPAELLPLLVEARQQQAVLKNLLSALGFDEKAAATSGGSALDEFTRRLHDRETAKVKGRTSSH